MYMKFDVTKRRIQERRYFDGSRSKSHEAWMIGIAALGNLGPSTLLLVDHMLVFATPSPYHATI